MIEVISKARQSGSLRRLAGVRIRKTLYGQVKLVGTVVGYEGDCLVIAYTAPTVRQSFHAERTPTNPTLLCEVPAGHSLLLTEPIGISIWEVDKEAERMRNWFRSHMMRVAYFAPYGVRQKGIIVGYFGSRAVIRTIYTRASKALTPVNVGDYNAGALKGLQPPSKAYRDYLVKVDNLRITKLTGIENI